MKTIQSRGMLRGTVLLLACTSLAGCGTLVEEGECFVLCGADTASLPPPPPANASVRDVAPPGTGSNTDRVVWSQELEDEELTGDLSFRLVQAPRSTQFKPTATVVAVTNISDAGTTLTIDVPEDPDAEAEVRFTVKDPAYQIEDLVLEEAAGSPDLMATLADGRLVRVALDMTDRNSSSPDSELNWTAYGAWSITSSDRNSQTSSYYVTGNETPDANLPDTGTANFQGFVVGNVILPDGQNVRAAGLRGDASVTVDFGTGKITGAAPDIIATPLGTVDITAPPTIGPAQAWNALTFSGTLAEGINGFSGTTGVSSAPGNSYSLASGADGYFSGLFYGPNANELGAVWNIADGVGAASGVLVGSQ